MANTAPTFSVAPVERLRDALDSLEWVEFSEDEAQPCMAIGGCDKEAVWKTVYELHCDCWPDTWYWCESDGLAMDRYYNEAWGNPECKRCEADMNIISHRRWRKGA